MAIEPNFGVTLAKLVLHQACRHTAPQMRTGLTWMIRLFALLFTLVLLLLSHGDATPTCSLWRAKFVSHPKHFLWRKTYSIKCPLS